MDYQSKIRVDFYSAKPGVSIDDVEVYIPFHVEMECRDWGIKDILVYFSDILTIPYIEESDEGEVDKQTIVDLSKLKSTQVAGQSITVWGMSLWLDQNGLVDYTKSEIQINMISPIY